MNHAMATVLLIPWLLLASSCSEQLGTKEKTNPDIKFSGINNVTVSEDGLLTVFWAAPESVTAKYSYQVYFNEVVAPSVDPEQKVTEFQLDGVPTHKPVVLNFPPEQTPASTGRPMQILTSDVEQYRFDKPLNKSKNYLVQVKVKDADGLFDGNAQVLLMQSVANGLVLTSAFKGCLATDGATPTDVKVGFNVPPYAR